ncbi:MAG: DUF2116 family Zn-ribbon domain-containing protein [Bacilli bacterium]|nr:DUF2116 family Zn-ribbon domain-containing protein [Bacilli bacterium]
MKCGKCGRSINENDDFCSNCGEKINKENKPNNTKTNKKLIIIFAVEIFLVFLVILIINNYYSNSDSKAISRNEFKEILTEKNYKIEDVTNESGADDIESYDFASAKDLSIHYIVADSNITAMDVFNSLCYQIKLKEKSGFISEYLIDDSYYSLENGGYYYVVSRKDNVLFSAMGIDGYKNEINKMVEEFGFGYSSNIMYGFIGVVIGIWIILFIALWKIFVKAGEKGWKSLIPFYNCYCLSKIVFNRGWLFILMLITPINLVFIPVTCYKLAKTFGKSTAFAVCSIFFPYITFQIIAFDNSKYIDFKKDK